MIVLWLYLYVKIKVRDNLIPIATWRIFCYFITKVLGLNLFSLRHLVFGKHQRKKEDVYEVKIHIRHDNAWLIVCLYGNGYLPGKDNYERLGGESRAGLY